MSMSKYASPALLFFLLSPILQFELRAETWLNGAIRINSEISSGTEGIDEIVQKAKSAGLDFVVISDQFIVKAEYGLPPLRKFIKYTITRKSITSYGIEEYLAKIDSARKHGGEITVIPGADLAPHYFWSGSPFKSNLVNHQFSQQMTVFGSRNPEFYRNLPVIHNRVPERDVLRIMIRSWPIILMVFGLIAILKMNVPYYTDRQGNRYVKRKWNRIVLGAILVLAGLAWTLNNRPLEKYFRFDQYHPQDITVYQELIDYVASSGESDTLIFWSAPEAHTLNNISGIKLETLPYISDVVKSDGHNGFAGIYGDTSKAHLPGMEWDMIIKDYLSGKRRTLPVIIGELDYHGRQDRPLDLIQTVIWTDEKNPTEKNILKAIAKGNSYAVVKNGDSIIELEKAELTDGTSHARLGETLNIQPDNGELSFEIRGHVRNEKTQNGEDILNIVLILDGELLADEKITASENFDFVRKITPDSGKSSCHYIRFFIKSSRSGWLLANPIFFRR